MSVHKRLLDAFDKYDVDYKEYIKRSEGLDELTGSERTKMQDELADWIESTFPLRKRKKTKREFSDSEKNAVNISFCDSLNGSLGAAGSNYEAFERSARFVIYYANLDVGYINESEDSDYRKIVSRRYVHQYCNEPDEELLKWAAEDREWIKFRAVIEQKIPAALCLQRWTAVAWVASDLSHFDFIS